jgi:5,10-methylenetetrahydrofolate reductase
MGLPLSFEFFPPKTPEGAQKLHAVRPAWAGEHPFLDSVAWVRLWRRRRHAQAHRFIARTPSDVAQLAGQGQLW